MKLNLKRKLPGLPDNQSARSEILNKLENTTGNNLSETMDFAGSFFYPPAQSLSLDFKKNLNEIKGECYLVTDKAELLLEIKQLIKNNNVQEVTCVEESIRLLLSEDGIPYNTELTETSEMVITGCEYLVSGLGSVVVSSAQAGSRRMFVFAPVHLIIACKNQIVESLENAYSLVLNKYGSHLPSFISVISGPSRTADIEKTLILGAHGPKSLHVCISEQDLFTK